MSALDAPATPCEPVCAVDQTDDGLTMCGRCGSLWRRQQLTEVDPVTMMPKRIESGWVRL